MTTIRLAAGLGLISLACGCSALGQYGALMQQPGVAGQPTAGGAASPASGAPAAAPATAGVNEAASTSETSAAGSSPSTVSVTIKSSCDKTVRVFFGEKPKFGSGTYSTVSSNSRSNHTFKPGDQMWIVDDKDNGLSAASVSESTKEIEILSSCSGLRGG
ncbi:MAG: hypothetical protein R3B13_04265 [Polyangiaceae bacterium]